jgi:hypothetical protein
VFAKSVGMVETGLYEFFRNNTNDQMRMNKCNSIIRKYLNKKKEISQNIRKQTIQNLLIKPAD